MRYLPSTVQSNWIDSFKTFVEEIKEFDIEKVKNLFNGREEYNALINPNFARQIRHFYSLKPVFNIKELNLGDNDVEIGLQMLKIFDFNVTSYKFKEFEDKIIHKGPFFIIENEFNDIVKNLVSPSRFKHDNHDILNAFSCFTYLGDGYYSLKNSKNEEHSIEHTKEKLLKVLVSDASIQNIFDPELILEYVSSKSSLKPTLDQINKLCVELKIPTILNDENLIADYIKEALKSVVLIDDILHYIKMKYFKIVTREQLYNSHLIVLENVKKEENELVEFCFIKKINTIEGIQNFVKEYLHTDIDVYWTCVKINKEHLLEDVNECIEQAIKKGFNYPLTIQKYVFDEINVEPTTKHVSKVAKDLGINLSLDRFVLIQTIFAKNSNYNLPKQTLINELKLYKYCEIDCEKIISYYTEMGLLMETSSGVYKLQEEFEFEPLIEKTIVKTVSQEIIASRKAKGEKITKPKTEKITKPKTEKITKEKKQITQKAAKTKQISIANIEEHKQAIDDLLMAIAI